MAQQTTDVRKVHKVGSYDFYDYDGYMDPAILTEKTAVSKSNPEGKISFTPDRAIIENLTTIGQQDIRDKTPDEFGDVVLAFVKLRTGEESPFDHPITAGKSGSNNGANFEDMLSIGRATATKYLKIAEIAGIFNPKSVSMASGERKDLDDKSLKDLDEFKKTKEVSDYLKSNEKHREDNNPQYLYRLFKASKILNMTPYQMSMKGMRGENTDKLAYIKDQLERLKTWSEDPDAKDPIVPTKKRILNPSNTFNPVDKLRNNATMYQFVKSIRAFLKANGISIPPQDARSRLSGKVVSHGFHAEQALTPRQILKMIDCLMNPVKEIEIPELFKGHWVDWDKWKKVKTFTKEFSMQSFWDDALFYFLIAIDMGMRAEEGFTIVAGNPKNDYASGVTEKKKTKDGYPIPKDENGFFKWYISLYTRKTEHLEASDKIHKGRVSDPMLIEMLQKRRADIDAPRPKGVVKLIQPDKRTKKLVPNTLHALIGVDDKYTKIATIDKSNSVSVPNNRGIVRDIMRHCFLTSVPKADRDESFDNFMEMPLHSLRHVFAQYWLHKSGRNYTFVARLGHWKTEKELKDSYGGMDDDEFDDDYERFRKIDALKSRSQIKKLIDQPEPTITKSERTETNKNYPKPENLKEEPVPAIEDTFATETEIPKEPTK